MFFFWVVVAIIVIILLAKVVNWAGGGEMRLHIGHFILNAGFN